MGINGGYTEEELSKSKELYPKEFQQAERREERNGNANKPCHFCGGLGHSTRRSKACGEHNVYLEQQERKKCAPQQQEEQMQTSTPDNQQDQTVRDSFECEVLDGMDLDGNDEFFDCMECCSDLNSNDGDCAVDISSDKKNNY